MRYAPFFFLLMLPFVAAAQTPVNTAVSDTLSRFLEPAAVTAVRGH